MKTKQDTFITNSFEETQRLAKDFAESLLKGSNPPLKAIVMALYGDLGSGKTTFVQGVAKGLGIKRRIISPTFIITRTYKLKPGTFCHIDLYRIGGKEDIKGLGLKEIMNNPENVVAIEWAEKMGKRLPKNRIDIKFEYIEENRRKIIITKIFNF